MITLRPTDPTPLQTTVVGTEYRYNFECATGRNSNDILWFGVRAATRYMFDLKRGLNPEWHLQLPGCPP